MNDLGLREGQIMPAELLIHVGLDLGVDLVDQIADFVIFIHRHPFCSMLHVARYILYHISEIFQGIRKVPQGNFVTYFKNGLFFEFLDHVPQAFFDAAGFIAQFFCGLFMREVAVAVENGDGVRRHQGTFDAQEIASFFNEWGNGL